MAIKTSRKKAGTSDKFTAWAKKQPLKNLIAYAVIAAVILGLIIMMIVKLLSPSPRTYDDYYETINEVMEVEEKATKASGAFRPIEEQVGSDFYRREVLGEEAQKYESATINQQRSIDLMEQNKVETRRLGGIADPSELEQYANSSAVIDPVIKQAVDESIAVAQGKSYEDQLDESLYIEPGSPELTN